jgi:acetoin utilization deacetylase AcuC-like enzyme
MDTYTPITSGTFSAAKSSVDVALTGAARVLGGERVVYSLCRPPGHHAEYKVMGGYCYFNNAAIAANYLSKHGKVAILDIDFHHGNGTQALFYDREDVLYVSLHADPRVRFPYSSGFAEETGDGKGQGFTKNYPMLLGTTNTQYLHSLRNALSDVQSFHPDFLVVSVGFDTSEHDPIGGFKLTTPFYQTIGREISSLELPTLLIQEGGYAVSELGHMACSFLSGFAALS